MASRTTTPLPPTTFLASATEAFRAGDEEIALERAIEAWRTTRSPAIAALVASLSARLEPHVPPLEGNLEAFQPAWLAMAKTGRAVDYPRLLQSALATTKRFGTAVVNALVARGEHLAEWPPDPRSAAIVIAHLTDGGYESTSRSTLPFWSSMFAILRSHDDARTVPLLRPVRFARVFRNFSDGKRRIEWFQREADAVVASLEARHAAGPAPLAKADEAAVAKLHDLVAKAKPPSQALVARLARATKAEPKAPRAASGATKAARGSVREHLDAAARAKDDPARLDALLEAWRVVPASEIAELADAVSRRIDARLPVVTGKNRAAIHAAWLALAKSGDPQDLPRLLASITHTMGRSTDALERLEALRGWPRDPRTTAGVVAQLDAPAFHSGSSRPFWGALLELVTLHGDPRATPSLDALAARYDRILAEKYSDRSALATWFRQRITAAADTLRPIVPKLAADDAKRCAALATTIGDLDAPFLARISATPKSDTPRAVYADFLQERGDPRGEFIALQLAKTKTVATKARADALQAEHAHAWVGALRPFLYLPDCTFERGFLTHAAAFRFEPDRFARIADDPAWGTVESLHLGYVEARKFPKLAAARALAKVTIDLDTKRRSIPIV